jgi:hypothetical protein
MEESGVRPCWLLVITKDLRVWMPPEVYLESGMAAREARRWASTLSRRRKPIEIDADFSMQLPRNAALHVVEKGFPEAWRACPLWVGVRWSSKQGAIPGTEMLAVESEDAAEWVRSGSGVALDPGSDPELRFEASWERGGVRSYVAAHRLKRFTGF